MEVPLRVSYFFSKLKIIKRFTRTNSKNMKFYEKILYSTILLLVTYLHYHKQQTHLVFSWIRSNRFWWRFIKQIMKLKTKCTSISFFIFIFYKHFTQIDQIKLYFLSASELKQLSSGWYLASLGHIIVLSASQAVFTLEWCVYSGETTNTNLIVFCLTDRGSKSHDLQH